MKYSVCYRAGVRLEVGFRGKEGEVKVYDEATCFPGGGLWGILNGEVSRKLHCPRLLHVCPAHQQTALVLTPQLGWNTNKIKENSYK